MKSSIRIKTRTPDSKLWHYSTFEKPIYKLNMVGVFVMPYPFKQDLLTCISFCRFDYHDIVIGIVKAIVCLY